MTNIKLKEELTDLLNSKGKKSFLSYCNTKRYLKEKILKETSFMDLVSGLKKIIISERVYCILNDISEMPVCPKCKKRKSFNKFEIGYNNSCGDKFCYQSMKEINEKRQKTATENFGSLRAAYHDTAVKTIKSKYGVDNVSKLEFIKRKKIKTSIRRYNREYPWQSEEGKSQQKNGVMKKYGVENVSQLDFIKEKKEETSMKNWGVRNPSQHSDIRKKILEKNGRQYILPSGKQILIDGDEHIALDYLYKIFNEEVVIPQPTDLQIKYYVDDKEYVWFPDVLIMDIHKNKIIEIKTLEMIFSSSEILRHKINGGLNSNYDPLIILTYENNLFSLYLLDFNENLWELTSINCLEKRFFMDAIDILEKNDFKLKYNLKYQNFEAGGLYDRKRITTI